jgi:choline monooxygenase
MQGCGNAKVLQCPYHAWTYGLDGQLQAAPRSEKEPEFSCHDYPLVPVQVDSLGPFVFANLDPNCKTVDYYFGPVLDIINECGLDLSQLWLHSRRTWDSHANWKVLLENYLECYHCPVAHPSFSAAIDVDEGSYRLLPHDWFFSQVGAVRRSRQKAAKEKEVKLYDLEGEVTQAQYHLLWPNFTISINPGFPNLSVDVWLPHGPSRTRGFSEHYFGSGVDEKWAQELIAFDEQVSAEDEALTSLVQEGLSGAIPEKGRFLKHSEQLIIHFQGLLLKALSAGE